MAVYDLEEQEQLDELKTWWKQYGNLVTGILLAVALIAAGWQGWNWWQRSQSSQAAGLFGALQQAAAQQDAKRSRELSGELIDKFGSTNYAPMGALIAARIQVDGGDAKNAKAQLAWAAEKSGDSSFRELARLRLASILLDEKAYDEALKQLATEPSAPFAARFAELRGDILASQGKAAEARAAYEIALGKAVAPASGDRDVRAGYRELLVAKRDSVGGGK